MGIPLFILAVSLMFSGVHGISQSMSCSTVNGKTICNKETNQGNTAMSSSSSWSGPGSSSQRTYAGAGDPNGQWQSSGQSVNSGSPDGFFNPFSNFDNTGSQAATGGFGNPRPEYSYSYPSSGFSDDYYSYDYPEYQAPDQTSADGFPSDGSSISYDESSTLSSGSFAGPLPGGVGSFAGGFSSSGFSSSFDDPPSFTSNTGSFAGPLPGGVGAFAGGSPFGGFGSSYAGPLPGGVGAFAGGFGFPGFGPSSFVPNVGSFVGSTAGGVGSFGFASAGGFPFLQPGIAYPPEDYDEPSGGNPPPQGSNGPAEMVASFMNNGFGGGAFAGAGAFPFNFGRR